MISEGWTTTDASWADGILRPISTLIEHDPNPGSDEAVDRGCSCDREANNYGDGGLFEQFYINPYCPLRVPRLDEDE